MGVSAQTMVVRAEVEASGIISGIASPNKGSSPLNKVIIVDKHLKDGLHFLLAFMYKSFQTVNGSIYRIKIRKVGDQIISSIKQRSKFLVVIVLRDVSPESGGSEVNRFTERRAGNEKRRDGGFSRHGQYFPKVLKGSNCDGGKDSEVSEEETMVFISFRSSRISLT